jgi:DNA topoisomerase-2
VNFEKNGRVRIYNNGPGIQVAVHQEASQKLNRTVYAPSFVFGVLFQGSNRKRDADSIIGGTNGLGAKLTNLFSTEFLVETVDGPRNLYFLQKWANHKNVEGDPIIIDLSKKN